MADLSRIKFKRSKVAGVRPTAAQLDEGELAINLKDRLLFTKDDTGVIIDLGFAKGGRIEGDVTHIGNYTQTGNYSVQGNVAIAGNKTTTGTDTAASYRSTDGVIYSKAKDATSASRVVFETSTGTEKGSLESPAQTDTSGKISLKVKDGNQAARPVSEFEFLGTGSFVSPESVSSKKLIASVSVESPLIDTSKKTTSTYSFIDLSNTVTAGINKVYRGRAFAEGTVWNKLIDETGVSEIAYKTGDQEDVKVLSFNKDGNLSISKSIMVGSAYSSLGDNSIALARPSDGFKSTQAGVIAGYINNSVVFSFSEESFNTSKRTVIIVPNLPNNTNILTLDTSSDSNGPNLVNSQTLLGYISSGKFYHYFRGKGYASFDMDEGVRITKGGINVVGTTSLGYVQASSAIITGGSLAIRGTPTRSISFDFQRNDGVWESDAYITKDSPENSNRGQALVLGVGTPSKESGVVRRQSWVFHENGELYCSAGVQLQAPLNTSAVAQNNWKWIDRNISSVDGPSLLRTFSSSSSSTIWNEVVNNTFYAISTGEIAATDSLNATFGLASTFYTNLNTSDVFINKGQMRIVPNDKSLSSLIIFNTGTQTTFLPTNANDPYGNGNKELMYFNHESGTVSAPYGFVSPLKEVPNSYYSMSALKAYTSTVMYDYGWARTGLKSAVHAVISGQGRLSNGIVWGDETGGGDVRFASIGASRAADGTSYVSLFGPLVQAKFSNDGSFRLWKQGQGSSGPFNNGEFWHLMSDGRASFIDVEIRSDIRYKRNVLPIKNALDKVNKLDGITYEVKDGDNKYTESAGLSAQDVEAILPMLVKENDQGIKSLSYNGIVGLLVNAVKELSAKVEALENK